VKDINDMKQQSRMLTVLGNALIGVAASLATAALILLLGGKL